MKWTVDHIKSLKEQGKIRDYTLIGSKKEGSKSKYGNTKVVIDGIAFDSKREGSRYMDLKILQLAGEIKDLKLQVPFELNDGGTHSLNYVADFVYIDKKGDTIVEDCKGYRTKVYLKKKKLMQSVHGITIKET